MGQNQQMLFSDEKIAMKDKPQLVKKRQLK